MRRYDISKLVWLLCLFVAITFVGRATAHDAITVERGTKEEAVAMVKKAIAYFKTNGPDKAFAAFDDPKKGPFIDRDLYIFVYDATGKCLAHGANGKLIGKNRIDDQDIDGKFFVKERAELMKTKQSFWQNYKWSDPLSHRIEPKESYCEVVSDPALKEIALCAGVYNIKK